MVYLTPRELAERYQVTDRQITALARSGIIPGLKIGKLWRFHPDRIEIWEQVQQGFDSQDLKKRVDEILDIQ